VTFFGVAGHVGADLCGSRRCTTEQAELLWAYFAFCDCLSLGNDAVVVCYSFGMEVGLSHVRPADYYVGHVATGFSLLRSDRVVTISAPCRQFRRLIELDNGYIKQPF